MMAVKKRDLLMTETRQRSFKEDTCDSHHITHSDKSPEYELQISNDSILQLFQCHI